MRTHQLNVSVVIAILGLTALTFGFQNCTKARFTIDETAKQKALGDGSVFDNNTPGDDGAVAGTLPGNDASVPGGKNPGNDNSMPKPPTAGNDPSMPGAQPTGDDPKIPADGSSIALVPRAVCGPQPFNMDSIGSKSPAPSQSTVASASKIIAVLYSVQGEGTLPMTGQGPANIVGSLGVSPKVVQTWDTDPDMTTIHDQLVARKSFQLKLKSSLAAGKYTVVLFDAAKAKSPYSYPTDSRSTVAPINDSAVSSLDAFATFTVNSSGKQTSPLSMTTMVGFSGGINQQDPACADAGMIDPLMIQLNASTPQPIALTSAQDGVMFDLLGEKLNHKPVQSAWFATSKSENYFLVLPNNDGKVLGIDELFGDTTMGPDKKFAKQGFDALAKYDDNGDRVISEDDPVFSKLRLWKDENLDGVVQESELFSLEEKGIVAIDLKYDKRYRETDKYGNMVKYKSVIVTKEGNYGLVYDLFLRYLNK